MNPRSHRSRVSSRLARRHKNGDKSGETVSESIVSLGQNGQPIDEIDMMFDGLRSKMYPICAPLNKKVNTHNLAEIPSLQDDENSTGGENGSQNSESADSFRKNYAKRKNANSLIESKNKFRQLLNQIQMKSKPMSNGASKCDSLFDGYELKSRRVKYEPRKTRREMMESNHANLNRGNHTDYFVKVLDRTIDLSQYCKLSPHQSIPLYPICRLWVRNNYGIPEFLRSKRNYPPPPMKEDSMDPDGPYSDSPVDVYHFPKPEPMPRDENGKLINLRIPKFVREFKRSVKESIADEINSMEHLTVQETLALSLPHWKNVKKEFLNAARENERRYRHSFAILKSMFEKYCLPVILF